MQSPQKVDLKANYIYNAAYQFLTIIVPLITTPYVSRVLEADNIGIYSFVNANLVYFVLVGVFGLSTYSQLEVARRRDDEKNLNQFCVESLLTRFITVGISSIAYIIIYLVCGTQYQVFYVIGICTLLANMFDVTWICQGLENFKIVAIRNAIVRLLGVIFVFVFVKTKEDLIWYFLINCVSGLIGNLSLFPYIRKYIDIKNINKIKIVPHLRASTIFFLPSVASVIITTVDKLMIGWFAVNMVQNGYYEQAMKIENMVFMIFAALNITMRPRMAYLYKKGQVSEINQYMEKSISFVVFLALPIVTGLIQIADIFVPWFFGEGYDGVIALLRIMSCWILIKSISNCLLEQSIVPKGGQVLATKIIWCAAALNILLNYLLIPHYAAVGAAIASLTTETLVLALTLINVQKDINVIKLFPRYWKAALSAAVMFICTGLIKQLLGGGMFNTVIIVVAGAGVYLLLELVLKDRLIVNGIEMIKGKIRGIR